MAANPNAVVQAQAQAQAPPAPPPPQLNAGLQQQLNLEDVRHRAHDLFNAISRIRQHLEANQNVKWQDVLSQFSVVNMGLVTIVEDIKKVSKAFVVYPKNVNQENSTKLPVMLSSKLLPEMELEETARKEQILGGLSNLPVLMQVDKLKSRIDAISAACNCAEKAINDSRKVYGLGTRHTPGNITPLDKVQVAKIEEQEKLLRAAANHGEGLRLPVDQRIEPTVLPPHLESGLASVDGDTSFAEATGALYPKSASSASPSIVVTNPGASHPISATQPIGRSAASPMAGTGGTSTENTTASPMQYANSPRSGPSMMNVPSPQQQQRAKVPHIPQQPQSYPSQQLRAQPTHANIQTHIPPSQEQQNQLQAKHQQDRPSYQNYPGRQYLPGSAQQHGITQNTSAQGSQSKHHLSGTSNPANLYSANQNFSAPQMFNMPPGYSRSLSQQVFPETGYNVGASGVSQSSTNMVLPQQHGGPSNFPTYSNPQFGGQSNLSSGANIPLGGSSNFSALSNHPSHFQNIVNLTQNPLHAQSNYGNNPNPTQNPNYGHPRQPPPQ